MSDSLFTDFNEGARACMEAGDQTVIAVGNEHVNPISNFGQDCFCFTFTLILLEKA